MRISVIIPVRNEERSIRSLLDALLNQTLPPDEIVITDGGSTDSTAKIIQEFIDRGAPVSLIRTAKSLPGRGRNLAVAKATNEWIAFTDGGIQPHKDWLATLATRAREDYAPDVVYGGYEPRIDTFFKECAAISYVSPPSEVEGLPMRGPSIASALMRRPVWEKVGGFPEHLRSAEDLLFMKRIEKENFRIVYEPRATVQWDLQPDLWHTLRRFTIYSGNNIRAGLWKQWQRPILTRYLLLLLLALPALFLGPWWLLAPVSLWLMLMVARAAVALWRNRRAFSASVFRNALRLIVLVPVLAVLDLGLLVGSLQWFLTDKLHLAPRGVKVGHGT